MNPELVKDVLERILVAITTIDRRTERIETAVEGLDNRLYRVERLLRDDPNDGNVYEKRDTERPEAPPKAP